MLTLVYPVRNPTISQEFGYDNTNHPLRKDFYKLFDNKHPGVDFLLPIGTKVFAAYPGVVVRKENHKGMGNVVATRNGNIVTLYAHLSAIKVALGQIVKQKDLIGLSGDTGNACNEPHLHFETRDITKQSLKHMVFRPPFNKQIKQAKEEFIYTVNNKNSQKSFESLSQLYFGNKKNWKVISDANKNVYSTKSKIIPEGTKIKIPNYKK